MYFLRYMRKNPARDKVIPVDRHERRIYDILTDWWPNSSSTSTTRMHCLAWMSFHNIFIVFYCYYHLSSSRLPFRYANGQKKIKSLFYDFIIWRTRVREVQRTILMGLGCDQHLNICEDICIISHGPPSASKDGNCLVGS